MRFSARRHERWRLLTRSDRASTTFPCRKSMSASRPCRLKSHGSRRHEEPNKHLSVPPPPFLSSTSQAEALEPGLPCLIRAALDAAVLMGRPYEGWCPKGGLAEVFLRPPGLLTLYPHLMETPSESPEQRTDWNVRDSAATAIGGKPSNSPGSPAYSLTPVGAGTRASR
jgi:hypothetical protein